VQLLLHRKFYNAFIFIAMKQQTRQAASSYPVRKACAGSILQARRPGAALATMALSKSVPTIAAKTIGSIGGV
jgi:hypothetical protein